MIITAAFQFAMGFLALMLRYGERGRFNHVVESIKTQVRRVVWLLTCFHCGPCRVVLRCCRRIRRVGRSSVPRASPRPSLADESPALDISRQSTPQSSRFGLFFRVFELGDWLANSFRWYWFLLAGQTGLMVREIIVIQMLNGWYPEVFAANLAMWIVILLTVRQVWQFSKVRNKSPRAVDQILDMLLLPINYGFLCALCVRILKLENTDQNRTIVSAMIDSADIWESWALWSVLKLFVKIVEHASQSVVNRENNFRKTERDRRASASSVASAGPRAVADKQEPGRASEVVQPSPDIGAAVAAPVAQQDVEAGAPTAVAAPVAQEDDVEAGAPMAVAAPLVQEDVESGLVEPSDELPSGHARTTGDLPESPRSRNQVRGPVDRRSISWPNVGRTQPRQGKWNERSSSQEPQPERGRSQPLKAKQNLKDPAMSPEIRRSEAQVLPPTSESAPVLKLSDRARSRTTSIQEETPEQLEEQVPFSEKEEETGSSEHTEMELPARDLEAEFAAEETSKANTPALGEPLESPEPEASLEQSNGAADLEELGEPEASSSKETAKEQVPLSPEDAMHALWKMPHCQSKALTTKARPATRPRFSSSSRPGSSATLNQEVPLPLAAAAVAAAEEALKTVKDTGKQTPPVPVSPPEVKRHTSIGGMGGGMGTRYLEVVTAFKKLSLSGVQAWVFILLVTTTVEVVFKGVLAPSVPTVCYWLYNKCESCNIYYDLNFYPTTQGIIYILCSFALIFVVAFERVFQDYLHGIQPYWKFWGVKIVVSVTYFQWLLFKYGFQMHEEEIYLTHSLVCCLEMPILCLLHATYAYPYGQEWMKHLLSDFSDAAMGSPAPLGIEDIQQPSGSWWERKGCCWTVLRFCYHTALFVISVVASVAIVCWLLPPALDLENLPPVYNITCSQEGMLSYLQGKNLSSHWALTHRKSGFAQLAGSDYWLPLCSSMTFGCQLGYRGHPEISCSAGGSYQVHGMCELVGCGAPQKVEHASPVIDEQQAKKGWTTGMTVRYSCDRGYAGQAFATCGNDGAWKFDSSQRCSLVGCGALEEFLTTFHWGTSDGWRQAMTMTGDHDLDRSYVGETVHFTCSPGYRGRPVALCHEGGHWRMSDACEPFQTSSKCRCKPRWVECDGWLQTDCKEWYGCRSGPEAYDWCEVEPGSCPSEAHDFWGAEPAWDYCVNDNFDIHWGPKAVAARGILPKTAGLYIAFAFAAALSFFCFMHLTMGTSKFCAGASRFKAVVSFRQCLSRTPGATRRWSRIVMWDIRNACYACSTAIAAATARLVQRTRDLLGAVVSYAQAAKESCVQRTQVMVGALRQRLSAAANFLCRIPCRPASRENGLRASLLHEGERADDVERQRGLQGPSSKLCPCFHAVLWRRP